MLEHLLRGHGALTERELGQALGVSQPTVSRLLAQIGRRIVRLGRASERLAIYGQYMIGIPMLITALGRPTSDGNSSTGRRGTCLLCRLPDNQVAESIVLPGFRLALAELREEMGIRD